MRGSCRHKARLYSWRRSGRCWKRESATIRSTVSGDELAAELTTLQRAIDEILAELRAKGRARVELGDLATTAPISPVWGLDRGIPLDRYYISAFLERHREDVRGRVLEVKDAGYTRTYGDGRVISSDVVDIDPNNDEATITADLTNAPSISDDTYDCFLLTQTLGVIYDVRAALATAHRVIKPGGVLLCTGACERPNLLRRSGAGR